MSHSYPHVPPHPKFPTTYGDNGSLTQFLARRVLNFRPSRFDPVFDSEKGYYVNGPSCVQTVRQNKGKRPYKQHLYRMRKNSEYRRNRAEVGRMLNEVREDGKL